MNGLSPFWKSLSEKLSLTTEKICVINWATPGRVCKPHIWSLAWQLSHAVFTVAFPTFLRVMGKSILQAVCLVQRSLCFWKYPHPLLECLGLSPNSAATFCSCVPWEAQKVDSSNRVPAISSEPQAWPSIKRVNNSDGPLSLTHSYPLTCLSLPFN